MKFSSSLVALSALVGLTVAAPTNIENAKRGSVVKRASVTETPTVGFATQNGGTTGGKGGATTTVSTLAQFTEAAKDDVARIIVISGTITGTTSTKVGSNKTIVGKDKNAKLVGTGISINKKNNVIVRNLSISKVLASSGDAIAIQYAKNVWIDHVDLSSDLDHDKDYYDGLLDVTHAADFVSITNSYLHDHFKASLVGHSDNNGAEDKGHLTVTYANRASSRMPKRTLSSASLWQMSPMR